MRQLLDPKVKVEQKSFHGIRAELANVDGDSVDEYAAGDENSHTGDVWDDGGHPFELRRQEVDERWELERHEVASGGCAVVGPFRRE